MVPTPTGDYVLFEDYERTRAALEGCVKALKEKKKVHEFAVSVLEEERAEYVAAGKIKERKEVSVLLCTEMGFVRELGELLVIAAAEKEGK